MSTTQVRELRALEGHRIGISIRGGDRIDDCELVSAGRGGSLWLFANGTDTFVPVADVVDLWAAA